MTKILLYITFLMCYVSALGQNFAKDMGAIQQIISDNNISFRTEAFYLTNDNSYLPLNSAKSTFYKNGTNYFVSSMGVDMLYTNEYVIIINHSSKFISVAKRPANDYKNINVMFLNMPTIDSLLNLSNTIVSYLGNAESIQTYNLDINRDGIAKMIYAIDTAKHFFSNIDVWYNNQAITGYKMIKIKYIDFSITPVFTENQFNISKYIIKKENEFVLTERYKGYELYYKDMNTKK